VIPSHALIERIAAFLDPDGSEDLLMRGAVEKAPPGMRSRISKSGM
jgi:hypothetical protein